MEENMKTTIKRFDDLTTFEIYDILALRTEIFIVEQDCIYADCDGKDKNAYHLYISENDSIIAYCRILDKGINFDEISLGRFAVRMDYRSKGLAKKMLGEVIGFIKNELKATSVKLSAQQYIMELYASYGFLPIGEPYDDDGIVHVDMEYRFG